MLVPTHLHYIAHGIISRLSRPSLLLIEDMRRPHQLHHFLVQEHDIRALARRLLMVYIADRDL